MTGRKNLRILLSSFLYRRHVMHKPKNLKGAGISYLGAGVAFLAVAASGQLAFLGVGLALIGLGIAFLAKSRNDRP